MLTCSSIHLPEAVKVTLLCGSQSQGREGKRWLGCMTASQPEYHDLQYDGAFYLIVNDSHIKIAQLLESVCEICMCLSHVGVQ